MELRQNQNRPQLKLTTPQLDRFSAADTLDIVAPVALCQQIILESVQVLTLNLDQ